MRLFDPSKPYLTQDVSGCQLEINLPIGPLIGIMVRKLASRSTEDTYPQLKRAGEEIWDSSPERYHPIESGLWEGNSPGWCFLLRIGDGSLFPLGFKVLELWKFSSKFALEK